MTTTTTKMSDLTVGAGLAHLYVENRNFLELEKINPALLLHKDRDGETAFHYAAINEDIEVCKLLIRRNPQLFNITDVEGKTAYDWIACYSEESGSHGEMLTYLKTLL